MNIKYEHTIHEKEVLTTVLKTGIRARKIKRKRCSLKDCRKLIESVTKADKTRRAGQYQTLSSTCI
jgi:hypothetical protein